MQLLGTRYRLAAVLGTGSGSVVWRGYDELLGRPVAVKVLSGTPADATAMSDRIRQEAMASARITHPNIAAVHDYGEAMEPDGVRMPYLVMEIVEAPSLALRLAEGPLPWPEAVRVGAQVAAAVLAAHEVGLVHRDISPTNVLLAPGGAKVIDFGISATIGEPESAHTQPRTPAFIAPERCDPGEVVHPAADVYALGVLLYQAISGTLPWPADSISPVPPQHGSGAPVPLTPDLPPPVAHLIERCLVRQPQDRPSSLEVALTLAQAAHAARWAAPPSRPERPVPVGPSDADAPTQPLPAPARPARPRLPRIVLISVLCLALLMGGAAVGVAASRTGPLAVAATQTGAAAGEAEQPPVASPRFDPPVAATVPGCAVTYHVRDRWTSGFTADVQLTNTGTAVSAWTLTFVLTGDQRIVQGWNGTFDQMGQVVTVRDAGYNALLQPGGTTLLGFNGSYDRQNPAPARFRLNGALCSLRTD